MSHLGANVSMDASRDQEVANQLEDEFHIELGISYENRLIENSIEVHT